MKKLLTMILAVVLVFTSLYASPMTANAQTNEGAVSSETTNKENSGSGETTTADTKINVVIGEYDKSYGSISVSIDDKNLDVGDYKVSLIYANKEIDQKFWYNLEITEVTKSNSNNEYAYFNYSYLGTITGNEEEVSAKLYKNNNGGLTEIEVNCTPKKIKIPNTRLNSVDLNSIVWNETDKTLSWNKVENAHHYHYIIQEDGTNHEVGFSGGMITDFNNSDETFTKSLTFLENKKYWVNISAVSGDYSQYLNSDYTVYELDLTIKEDLDKYKAAKDVKWAEKAGMVSFINVNEDINTKYFVKVYKKGNPNVLSEGIVNEETKAFFYRPNAFNEDGTYYFTMETLYKDGRGLPNTLVESDHFTYKMPDQKLMAPTNIRLENNTVSWSPVEGAFGYEFSLIPTDGEGSGLLPVNNIVTMATSASFAEEYELEKYDYVFSVRALSNDITKVANGTEYAIIHTNAKSVTDGKLNEALDGGKTTTEKVNAVKDAFTSTEDKNALKDAMQKDESTKKKISNLEDTFKKENKIEVNTEGEYKNNVSVVGAALNVASDAKNKTITLSINKSNIDIKAEETIEKSVVLDLNISGDGIDSKNLAIPVTITMPIPDGMNASKLVVMHYNDDNSSYDILPIKVEGNNVSFTVTHFSNFLFGEKKESYNGGNNDIIINNDSSDSDSVIVNGKPWKPTTSEEFYRYNLRGKEKIQAKVNANNAYKLKIENAMQGPKCFVSFNAVLGKYTIGRTYNIMPNGKKVYSMKDVAEIKLDIPKNLQRRGRTFKMICVTENGTPIVLNDLDRDPNTITFKTNKYYAFALVYKDK